ncbi:hypothetical protein [Flavobacterium sp.]|uniref:hypothetical protein n=1 Tax=Flavobacterium sp. TaxID=239 RepID=UPI0026340BA9|nr:hypothetical protein [Flavobacterium sp.]
MTSSDVTAFFAILISVLALLFTFLNFRREKNKINQDLIFQEKITAYKDLIFQANQTYELLYFLVEEVQSYEGTDKEWENNFDKVCGQYYNHGYEFQKLLFKYMPILPNEIYKEMDKFCTSTIGFVTSSFHCNSNATIQSYDNIEKKLHKIIDYVRTDLNVDKLNVVLSDRLK